MGALFVGRYEAITEEARLSSIDYEIRTSDKSATEVDFRVEFHSDFFGDFPETNTIPLVRDTDELVIPSGDAEADEATADSPTDTPATTSEHQPTGEWRVQWSPSLYFRSLSGENLVHFFTRVPRRGSILDRFGTPMAVDADLTQIGIVPEALPHTGFQIFRQPDRQILVLSPFRLGEEPNIRAGIAMITSAPEALALHQKTAEGMWGRAHKGPAAAKFLRNLLAQNKD